jgi:pyruvate carboxylase subunit B
MEVAFKAIQECGKHIQACLCYSLTERRLGGPIFNIEYFLAKARTVEQMGAQSLCIKDMAGLMAPYDTYELVKVLKEALDIPIHLHTHYTSGMASMTYLKAVEAGCDVVDTALAPFALRTSQPAVEPLVVALQGTPRDTGLDLPLLSRLGLKLEAIAPKYRDYLDHTRMSVIDTQVLMHQTPGGMLTNLVSQLKQAEALDRLDDVFAEIPRTRTELGTPPLVTPTSQIVGAQAVSNVLFGRYKMVSQEVKDYVYGLYGRPPAAIDPEVSQQVLKGYLRGDEPITSRPGDVLESEMEGAREAVKDISDKNEDALTYALYPNTGLQYLRVKHGFEKPEEEATPAAASASVSPAPQPESRPAGMRTFHVYVEGDYLKVEVAAEGAARRAVRLPVTWERDDISAMATPATAAEAIDTAPGALLAPMPGMVVRYEVEVGAKVEAGDPVVVFEAMKMQNVLAATTSGVVKERTLKPGDKAGKGDILAVITTG